MADALAGNLIRAEDHVDTIVAGIAVDTTVGTAATDFTVITAVVRSLLGDHLIDFSLYVTTTNALTASGGNITDVACFTLDAAFRPSDVKTAVFGNGLVTGEARLDTNGVVTLRSASDTVAALTDLRMNFAYVRP